MAEDMPRLFVLTGLIVGLTLLWQSWQTTGTIAVAPVVLIQETQKVVNGEQEAGSEGQSVVRQSPSLPAVEDRSVLVTRVIDGDTIEIEGGIRVRYIGVNTPESVDPRRPVQCFGKEASAYNRQRVEGKRIILEADVEDRDKYGRLLRYVWFGDTMINEKLVADGYAQVMTIPPNVKYVQRFKAAQTEARKAKRGLWIECSSRK